MLDDEDGGPRGLHAQNCAAEVLDFTAGQSGRRFVKEKQFCIAGERAGHRDEALLAKCQSCGQRLRQLTDADNLHGFFRALSRFGQVSAISTKMCGCLQQIAVTMIFRTDEDVLLDRHQSKVLASWNVRMIPRCAR